MNKNPTNRIGKRKLVSCTTETPYESKLYQHTARAICQRGIRGMVPAGNPASACLFVGIICQQCVMSGYFASIFTLLDRKNRIRLRKPANNAVVADNWEQNRQACRYRILNMGDHSRFFFHNRWDSGTT